MLKWKEDSEMLKTIQEKGPEALYRCARATITVIIDQESFYQKNEWPLNFLKELIRRYQVPVILLLNAYEGILMLKKTIVSDKEMTQEILQL